MGYMADGKVLFFNQNDGEGIIITSQEEKIDFHVRMWNDYNIMPSVGLLVSFNHKNFVATKVITKSDEMTNSIEIHEKAKKIYENSPLVVEKLSENKFKSIKKIDEEDDYDDEEEYYDDEDEYYDDDYYENYELPPKKKNITITTNLHLSVENYFKIIEQQIKSRAGYKKLSGRLNYFVIKRFLWTTFNNLTEIDLHIVTPKLKMLSDDLKTMGKVYENYSTKVRLPHLAYDEVFLLCQAEYLNVRKGTQKIEEKINRLKVKQEVLGGLLKAKKEEHARKMGDSNIMNEEFKSMNTEYVNVIHLLAELSERYNHDLELLYSFEKEYKDDFYKVFLEKAKKYKKSLTEILNAQAYIVDAQLWQQAKKSRFVKAHFKTSLVAGELNTKTYLKYYLDTLDATKSTDDNQKLFDLYEYLVSIHKDYILIVVRSAQDAMEYEMSIKNIDKSYHVKSFLDEKAAIKWAMSNSVKILVVEDTLQRVNAEIFLNVYHNNIFAKPKIVVIGNKPRNESNTYSINKLLVKNASSKVLVENIKLIIAVKQP